MSGVVGPASVIKSVQRGAVVVNTSASVTVSAVDTAKAVLSVSVAEGIGNSLPVGAGGALSNSTTLSFTEATIANVAGHVGPTVWWQLVEYQ